MSNVEDTEDYPLNGGAFGIWNNFGHFGYSQSSPEQVDGQVGISTGGHEEQAHFEPGAGVENGDSSLRNLRG